MSKLKTSYLSNLAFGGGVDQFGPKAHRLSQLYQSGFRVPNGFVILKNGFDKFLEENKSIISKPSIEENSLTLPLELEKCVISSYRSMFGTSKVVVRSSATLEDSANVSPMPLSSTIS